MQRSERCMMVVRCGTVRSSESILPTSLCRVDRHDSVRLREEGGKKMEELTMVDGIDRVDRIDDGHGLQAAKPSHIGGRTPQHRLSQLCQQLHDRALSGTRRGRAGWGGRPEDLGRKNKNENINRLSFTRLNG